MLYIKTKGQKCIRYHLSIVADGQSVQLKCLFKLTHFLTLIHPTYGCYHISEWLAMAAWFPLSDRHSYSNFRDANSSKKNHWYLLCCQVLNVSFNWKTDICGKSYHSMTFYSLAKSEMMQRRNGVWLYNAVNMKIYCGLWLENLLM